MSSPFTPSRIIFTLVVVLACCVFDGNQCLWQKLGGPREGTLEASRVPEKRVGWGVKAQRWLWPVWPAHDWPA